MASLSVLKVVATAGKESTCWGAQRCMQQKHWILSVGVRHAARELASHPPTSPVISFPSILCDVDPSYLPEASARAAAEGSSAIRFIFTGL